MKNILAFLAIAFVFVFGLTLGRNNSPRSDTIISVDTLVVYQRDTLREMLYKTIEKRVTDTLHFFTNDTTFIVLNREQKVVEGRKFKAWISGVKPNLDSIETYNDIETRYIDKLVRINSPPKRWGVGIQAGLGATLQDNKLTAFPYIGVGLSYNIIRF